MSLHDNKIPIPNTSTIIKLASIAAHAEEATSGNGHEFDVHAIRSLISDPDVVAYLDQFRAAVPALLPVKR